MTHTETQNKLVELAIAYKKDQIDLEDAEILERSALKMIATYIIDHNLSEAEPLNFSEATSDKLRYIIDSSSVTNDTILDLNWAFKSAFWPDEVDSKECYLELIKEMLENKATFYDLEDF